MNRPRNQDETRSARLGRAIVDTVRVRAGGIVAAVSGGFLVLARNAGDGNRTHASASTTTSTLPVTVFGTEPPPNPGPGRENGLVPHVIGLRLGT
jgi:hypothetical protein